MQRHIILVIIFIFTFCDYFRIHIKGQCVPNCSVCISNSVCQLCDSGFTYDSKQIACIYSQCQDQLYLQVLKNDQGEKYNQCVSICQSSFYRNDLNKVCSSIQQCSSEFFIQTSSPQRQGGAKEIILFQQSYFLVFYNQIVDYIIKQNGQLEQSVQFDNNIIQWQNFNGQIFLFSNNNQLYLWDAVFNVKTSIQTVTQGQITNDSVIIQSDQQIGYLLTFDLENFIIFVIPFIDIQSMDVFFTMTFIQLPFNNYKYFIKDNLIFLASQQQIQIFGIISDNNKNCTINKIQTCIYPQASQINGEIVDVIKIDISFYFIFSDFLGIVKCDTNSFQFISTEQQPRKLMLLQVISGQQLVITLFPSSLMIFEKNIQLIQVVNSFQNLQIIDISLLQIDDEIQEIYILLSSNELQIYQDNQQQDINQIVNFQLKEVVTTNHKFINNLQIVSSNNNSEIYLVLVGQDGFEVINKKQLQQNTNKNTQFVFTQFSSQPVTNSASISDILIIEDQNLLLSCSLDGSILIWDNTHKYRTFYNMKISIQNDKCLKLYKFSQNLIIAQFYNQIIFINPNQQVPLKSISKQSPNPPNEFISCSNNKSALIYDSNFYLIDQNFNILIQSNSQNLIQDVQMIFLNQDLTLVVSRKEDITIYQLDPSQSQNNSQISLKFQFQFNQSILQYSKIKYYPINLQTQLNYEYEVLSFDSQSNFYIFDNQLNILTQIKSVPIQKAIDINFSYQYPLDPTYFIFGLTNQLTASFPFQTYAVRKDSQQPILAANIIFGIHMMEPVLIFDSQGNVKSYQIQFAMPLTYFTINMVFRYSPTTQSNIQYLELNIQNENQSSYKTYSSLSYNYMGFDSGFLGVIPLKKQYSQMIFQDQSIQIINVILNFQLERFFVISKKVQVFSIHTNQLIEEVIFIDENIQQVQGFQLFQQQKIFIAYKSQQLIMKNLETNKLYSYTNLTYINSYFLENNYITVFGNRIVQLNMSLNEIFEFNQLDITTNLPQVVANSSANYYCKLSDGSLLVLSKMNLQILSQTKSKQIGPNFQIFLDEEMGNLFLYNSTALFIYNLVGINQNRQIDLNLQINKIQIFGQYLCITIIGNINIFQRSSLVQLGQFVSTGGRQIINAKYIDSTNTLLIWTIQIRFSQVTVYDLNTFSIIQNIKNTYTQNNPSVVVDVSFDQFVNQIVFLDITGNILCIDMVQYGQNGLLKINEFTETNNPPLGFQLDYDMNSILVYNSNSIYQINYSDLVMRFLRIIEYKHNQFIKIIGQTSIQNQFYIISQNNVIFQYQNKNFFYLNIFDEQDSIQEAVYISSINVFVVSFSSFVNVYQKFSPSNPDFSNKITISNYQFKQFILNGIFITSDGSLVDYDFLQLKENQKIAWGPSSRMTVNLCVESFNLIIIGLNQGDCIIYNYSSKVYNRISIDTNPILYLSQTENYVWVCSAAGIVKQILGKSNQIIKTYNISSIIQLQLNDIIGTFEVDEVNQRIFVNIIEQKLIYVINFSQAIYSVSHLSFPTYNNCQIQFSQNFLLLYSSFQINIYTRNSLQFLKCLRRDINADEIKQVNFPLEQFFIISFLQKFEVFYYDQNLNSIKMIDQVVTSLPQIIDIDIIQDANQQIQIIAFSQDLFFVKRYTIALASSGQLQCSAVVQVQDYVTTQLQLSLIKKPIQPSLDWKSMVQIQVGSNSNQYFLMLQNGNLNNVNSNLIVGGQFIIQSDSSANQNVQLQISNQTFTSFSKTDLNLNNLSFIFTQNQTNQQQEIIVNLSQVIQIVRFQNIFIQDQINMDSVQLNFINLNLVVFQNILINGSNSSQLNRLLQNKQNNSLQGFAYFYNCSEVYFYNITVQNLEFVNQIQQSLFSFNKIQKLVIDGLQIQNSSFYVPNNNVIQSQIYLIVIQGCYQSNLEDILFIQNTNLSLLYITKEIQYQDSLSYLVTDQAQFLNIQIFNNFYSIISDTQSTIKILSSYVYLQSLQVQNNTANLQIISSVNVSIVSCKFINNTSTNGGAIIFNQINILVNITKSQFLLNSAQASGGGLYLIQEQGTISIDESNFISGNVACIGGGIRLYSSSLGNVQQHITMKIIQNNKGFIYGNDFATFAQKISILSRTVKSLYYQQNEIEKQLISTYSGLFQMQHFNSGDSANLEVRIYDQDDREISFDVQKVNQNIYPSSIIEEIKSYYIQILSNNITYITVNGENFVTLLAKLFVCRQIGEKLYVSQDLRLDCDDKSFNLFVQLFATPILAFWFSCYLQIYVFLWRVQAQILLLGLRKNIPQGDNSLITLQSYQIDLKQLLRWKMLYKNLPLIIGKRAINNLEQMQNQINSRATSQTYLKSLNDQQVIFRQSIRTVCFENIQKLIQQETNPQKSQFSTKNLALNSNKDSQLDESDMLSFQSNPIKEDLDENKQQVISTPQSTYNQNSKIFSINTLRSQLNENQNEQIIDKQEFAKNKPSII
ncbi:hypothetical protein ABPG73_011050 [Tetrahymena malaccensis]